MVSAAFFLALFMGQSFGNPIASRAFSLVDSIENCETSEVLNRKFGLREAAANVAVKKRELRDSLGVLISSGPIGVPAGEKEAESFLRLAKLLVRDKKESEARLILESVRTDGAGGPEARRKAASILLLLTMNSGRYETVTASDLKDIEGSLLEGQILDKLASWKERNGGLEGAIQLRKVILERFKGEPFEVKSRLALAGLYLQSGDAKKCEDELSILLMDERVAMQALFLKAQLEEKNSKPESALEYWKEIIRSFPKTKESEEAGKRIQAIRRTQRKPLTDEDKYFTSISALRGRSPSKALLQLRQLSLRSRQPEVMKLSLVSLGDYLQSKRMYSQAFDAYRKAISLENDPGEKAGIALKIGRVSMAIGRYKEAISSYTEASRASPGDATFDAALWELGRVWEHIGELDSAIVVYRRSFSVPPFSNAKAQAVSRAGLCALRLGRPGEALELMTSLFRADIDTSIRGSAHFWAGKALLCLGLNGKALSQFELAGRMGENSYHGVRGRELLGEMSGGERGVDGGAARDGSQAWRGGSMYYFLEVLSDSDSTLSPDRAFRIATELFSCGMKSDAASLLTKNHRSYDPSCRLLRAFLLSYESMVPQSLLVGRTIPDGSYNLSLPYGKAKVLHPLAFVSEFSTASSRAGVDMLLLLSIAKSESSFEPQSVSPKGATGLMQLMPQTARSISRKAGLKRVEKKELFSPEKNTLLGAHELSRMIERFNGNLTFAIAAYNAGPDAVASWVSTSSEKDPDMFVETIPYKETRKYVKDVIASYAAYSELYPNLSRE
ncbi:MAG: transglycosylase SLT domain-containing protein [Candidatus Eisenbacteria bacterium]|nr:transglycosylase SLT domain-containing protein [Candidatus Eisenbacteria bacterium]